MTREELQHVAHHLSKYAGELAAIAEALGHDDPAKVRWARSLLQRWRHGDRSQDVEWCRVEVDRLVPGLIEELTSELEKVREETRRIEYGK